MRIPFEGGKGERGRGFLECFVVVVVVVVVVG